jgi:type VI secretion system Hcp family effector
VGTIKRTGKVALILAVGAAGGGAALAVASVPGSDGVISACIDVTNNASNVQVPVATAGNLEIIDTAAGETCTAPVTKGVDTGPGQTTLQWSATGPQGPAGPQGVAGTPGATGLTGVPGAISTIAGGSTLTLPNREVITVGGLLTPPAVKSGPALGTFTFKLPHQGSVGAGGSSSSYSFNILGFQLESQTPVDSGSGSANGARQHSTVTITKEVDSASPSLFRALTDDEVIKSARIVISKGGGGESYAITLTNAIVSDLQRSTSGTRSLETLTFSFQKIAVEYTKAK